MSRLIRKTSFTGGEVNKNLIERFNLVKVQSGLETARNCVVTKDARLISRDGTEYYRVASTTSGNYMYVEVPNTNYILEFTNLKCRKHDMIAGTFVDITTDIADASIPDLDFCVSNIYANSSSVEITNKCVLLFRKGDPIRVIDLITNSFDYTYYDIPQGSYISASLAATGAPSGYEVEYSITVIKPDKQETLSFQQSFAAPKLPVSGSQFNTITVVTGVIVTPAIEYRFYRRPKDGGAFGYIGSSFDQTAGGGGTFVAKFVDFGQPADFSINPPKYIISTVTKVAELYPKTGTVIGGRLYIGNTSDNSEYVYGSRVNHPMNFTRDYPYSDDSALLLKAGQTGAANVLKIADGGGTIIDFTEVGIYANEKGPITPTSNSSLFNVGSSIINEKLPPLKFKDFLLFVDKTDNSIKKLDFANSRQNYNSDDLTIFSGHLFEGKTIVSWTTQKYGDPIVWASMDDGSLISFTFDDSQELRAWCRHDFYNGLVRWVTSYGVGVNSRVAIVIERNGVRYIEKLNNRFIQTNQTNLLDSSVYLEKSLHSVLGTTVAALGLSFTDLSSGGDWTGNVRLDSTAGLFTGAMVGKIYRQFDTDKQAIDYLCISVPSTNQAVFTKNPENPYDEVSVQYRSNIILYETFTTLTGLNHLNDENVSVYCDNSVIASPLNDIQNLPKITVSGGQITIPRSAFACAGLPFVCDIGTFEIISEDPKISVQGKTTGQVYIKTAKSKGFYVGPEFPANDSVIGMSEPDLFDVDNPQNAALPEKTKRFKVTLTNDWKSNGRVCIRVVDPVRLELLSIIANVTFS